MSARSYQDMKDSLRQIYVEDDHPWLVGFSGGEGMEKLLDFHESLQYELAA